MMYAPNVFTVDVAGLLAGADRGKSFDLLSSLCVVLMPCFH